MANFNGAECIVCKKKFTSNDDIVVCPECGTPYHRECYKKNGECINKELHESGGTWSYSKPDGTSEDTRRICRVCGTGNSEHSLMCEKCGTPLVEGIPDPEKQYEKKDGYDNIIRIDPNDKCCGFDPNEDFEGVKLSEVADFVGKNTVYYLPIFKRMKDFGKRNSLNLICLFFPEFYFASRKMWSMTALNVAVTFILALPSIIYTMIQANIGGGLISGINVTGDGFLLVMRLASYINWAFKLFICLFANHLYYMHVIKKIKEIRESTGGAELSSENAERYGGTSPAGIAITILIYAVLSSISMLALKIL